MTLVTVRVVCSLRTTLCLQHPPELIAAGAVFAALKLHRVKPGPSLSDPREWFQQGPVNADAAALEGAHRSPLPLFCSAASMQASIPCRGASFCCSNIMRSQTHVIHACNDFTVPRDCPMSQICVHARVRAGGGGGGVGGGGHLGQ